MLLDRIGRFCVEMDTETPPREAVEMVAAWFSTGNQGLGLWAVIDPAFAIRAHLLATPEPAAGGPYRYVLVRQAKADTGVDTREATEAVFDQVKAWARMLGAPRILMVTHRDERAMGKKYGFQSYKALMRLDLEPFPAPESQEAIDGRG